MSPPAGKSDAEDPKDPSKAAADDKDEGFTLQELLEEEDSLQADAAAVLGASDDKNCSYPHGYVDRQALYACATCSTPESPAGVCLACSYACHENHELYELYTKRGFRCDCGNEKFGGMKCTLFPAKAATNPNNSYNHNFKGKYCRCARPYPDPERKDPEEMWQCVVCEDWFHPCHIGLPTICTETVEELICDECMKAHPFLWRYKSNIERIKTDAGPKSEKSSPAKAVNVSTSEDTPPAKRVRLTEDTASAEAQKDNPDKNDTPSKVDKPNEEKTEAEPSAEKSRCILETLPEVDPLPTSGAVWPKAWRRLLCTCESCKEMYAEQKIDFLAQAEDTVGAYEERGAKREDGTAGHDPLMKVLDKLGHVQKIDIIDGYNNLKQSLSDFLRKQAEQKKVVTAEDVRNFFEELKSTTQRNRPADPVYFCR